ncbi:[Acyl-carrier-protein] S-malonyltransferase [Desulfuromusa kysingii]|uniref:Malonyl CoA-acyl carrier protein transacylase n=1 Tax=Desulfuromusa kysingii TaxID=37625 RepID=A0A1H4D330_9BACT|nr:ACP S-malonyltransferase [Desulfuromusa kysingii]SEA66946.1 [Acyl-carrier-protein] S-malonyltransferase [Desulfuromusa kysingii]
MDAFVFPGQGSQYQGMGKDLSENFKIAQLVYEEANDSLGFDIKALCFSGPEDALKLTANTQPAILATSIAALRVLQAETNLSPSFVAGHSLGEYSALVAAGALTFADALRIVRKRGTYMQEAVPFGVGAMAAILGVEGDAIVELCEQAAADEVVAPANFNSPGQIVIAGHTAAVKRAIELAKERGAKRAMLLPVSAPFHSILMAPAAQRLLPELNLITVSPLTCPVITNVEALPNDDESKVIELLVKQVCAPVRWDESILKMKDLGVTRYIEIGPGKVLSGLIKRIDRAATLKNIGDVPSLEKIQGSSDI